MELDISWEESGITQAQQEELTELLRKGIYEALLVGDGPENAEIGLVLVNDEKIRELNKQYRAIDAPTDVLSFALEEKGEDEPEIFFDYLEEEDSDEEYAEEYAEELFDLALGDIVISVERARAQAEEFGHSLNREIVYLAVHGTLHLLGFDHERDEETAVMRQKEEEVMNRLNLLR